MVTQFARYFFSQFDARPATASQCLWNVIACNLMTYASSSLNVEQFEILKFQFVVAVEGEKTSHDGAASASMTVFLLFEYSNLKAIHRMIKQIFIFHSSLNFFYLKKKQQQFVKMNAKAIRYAWISVVLLKVQFAWESVSQITYFAVHSTLLLAAAVSYARTHIHTHTNT